MTVEDTSQFSESDIAPISTSSSPEALQEIMDIAAAGAMAQKELEDSGQDPFAPDDTTDTAENLEEGEDEGESEAAEESAEEQPETDQQPKPRQQPKPGEQDEQRFSRRDAPRLARDLETTRTELQQTQAALNARQAADASIMSAIEQQAGSEQEFQQLLHTVRRTPEQQARYEVMAQWRQVAGPIYARAQTQVINAWSGAFNAAARLDGMTEQAHQQVMTATDPQKALKLIHEAGQKAAEKKAAAEIQRLKAEVSSLKTKVVTTKPQPATPDGTPPMGGSKLPPMLNADGTLNPEFEKLAHSGKLYGVEHLQ